MISVVRHVSTAVVGTSYMLFSKCLRDFAILRYAGSTGGKQRTLIIVAVSVTVVVGPGMG